jgi:glycosyltransferase involved in cell wall biosynthesis
MEAISHLRFNRQAWRAAAESVTRPVAAPRADERLRVLRVAHASLTPALRARERALALNHPEIDLEVVTTSSWQEAGVEVAAQADDLFPVTPARALLSRHIQLFAYDPRPLRAALLRHRPHLIDLNHEPYSVAGAEVLWLCRRYAPPAKIVMQTAQNIYKNYPPPFSWFERRAFREVDAAYVCSLTVRDTLRAKGFAKPVGLIPFGVDLAEFTPRAARAETPVIGFVGRMLPGKGLPVLAAALQRIAGEDWRAFIVGDGPERDAAAQQLAAAGLSARVTMTGALAYERMPEILRQMDVLVVPSQTTKRLREQFGRVIVEAMASRVCVVGSDSGAIPEVVGDAGLIFPEGDADALAAALRRVIRNAQERERLAVAGRRRVERHYSWERVAEQTADFYRRVQAFRVPSSDGSLPARSKTRVNAEL